jgi:hypothetical protein
MQSLPLARTACEFVHPDAPLAHPLDDGTRSSRSESVAQDRRQPRRRRRGPRIEP